MGTKRVKRMNETKEKLEKAGYTVQYSISGNLEIFTNDSARDAALEIERLLDFPHCDLRWAGNSVFLFFYDWS